MVCSPTVCGFYSGTGMIFMLFVYVLLSTQPFLIKGIDDVDDAKRNAFGAMLTFVATFAISVFLMLKGSGVNGGEPRVDGDKEGYTRLNIDLSRTYGSEGVSN